MIPERRSGEASPGEVARESATPPVHRVRKHQVVFTFQGGKVRGGPWQAARNVYAIGVMGGLELDFREAILPSAVTDVYVASCFGGMTIHVPPGVRVRCEGIGLLGAFQDDSDQQTADLFGGPHQAPAPVLRIRGFALVGAVNVVQY